jgi:hypothetical protein
MKRAHTYLSSGENGVPKHTKTKKDTYNEGASWGRKSDGKK